MGGFAATPMAQRNVFITQVKFALAVCADAVDLPYDICHLFFCCGYWSLSTSGNVIENFCHGCFLPSGAWIDPKSTSISLKSICCMAFRSDAMEYLPKLK